MKRVMPWLAVSAVLVTSAGCARAPETLSDAHATAMRDSVQALLAEFTTRFAAKEWDSVGRFYAEDARFRWVEDGVVRYRSAAEVRRALAAVPASMRIKTTYRDTEVLPLAPGLASVVTQFQTSFADSAGRGFTFGGAITMTLVHLQDGWKFLGGHTSSPRARGPTGR